MRKSFVALGLLFNFTMPAFACPDLTGNYLCPEPSGTNYRVNFLLFEGPTGPEYSVRAYGVDEHFTTDMKEGSVKDVMFFRNGKYQARCEGDEKFLIDYVGQYLLGTVLLDHEETREFSLRGPNLRTVINGTQSLGGKFVIFRLNYDFECTRI